MCVGVELGGLVFRGTFGLALGERSLEITELRSFEFLEMRRWAGCCWLVEVGCANGREGQGGLRD